TLQACMRCRHYVVLKFLHETGFANPSLAAQDHYLTHAVLHALPALAQQPDLGLAAYQRREAPGHRSIQAALHTALLQDAVGLDGRGNAFEHVGPQVVIIKILADQGPGSGADDHSIWHGQSFESSSEVGSLPEG